MDPDEIEFIGEKLSIGIIPNFNFDPIHLIQSTIGKVILCFIELVVNFSFLGPFRAGLPMHVPLWLAVHMKKQQKCRIVPPTWMDRDLLEDQKEEEKREPLVSINCNQQKFSTVDCFPF